MAERNSGRDKAAVLTLFSRNSALFSDLNPARYATTNVAYLRFPFIDLG